MQTVSVAASLRFGWDTFKKRPLMLASGFLIGIVVMTVSSVIFEQPEAEPSIQGFMLGLISAIIGLLVEIGFVTFALRAHDAIERVDLKTLWNPKPFLPYLAGQILVGLAVLVGLVLLIVPGIIAALGFLFSSYLIVDKGRGPIEAMKESWRITKGNRWKLFLLVLAIAGINIVGFFLLVVGLLVTIPVTMLALAHAYRTLEHAASEIEPVPTA